MGEPIGAVKLVVRAQDAETAREILTGDHSADLAAVPESHLPPSADELCPRCGTELVDLRRRRFGRLPEWLRVLASGLRGGGFAPDQRPAGRCPACGHVER